VIQALRNGTVPRRGLDLFAVAMEKFERPLDEDLDRVAAGGGAFKALRGDFGCGKTFTARWFQRYAQHRGFVTAEVQISETDTPLHRLETVYRRAMESLSTDRWHRTAFRSLVESWFVSLEEEVNVGRTTPDPESTAREVGRLLDGRLAAVSATQPQYAAALRGCYEARVRGDNATAEGLLAWLMGQPNVGAGTKRHAALKGDIDHTAALAFLRGLLAVLRQTGKNGLMLVLDEVETIQRARADSREKSLNGLRQLIDALDNGEFGGVYLMITGTPSFFDGPHGVRRAPALASRIHTDFAATPGFEKLRAPQVRLAAFDHDRLVQVGRRVRELYPARNPQRIEERVTDAVIARLARGVTGKLGGKTGVAPRLFLKKLVIDILDLVDDDAAYWPDRHHRLLIEAVELTPEERNAAGSGRGIDQIALEDPEDAGA